MEKSRANKFTCLTRRYSGDDEGQKGRLPPELHINTEGDPSFTFHQEQSNVTESG